MKEEAIVVGTEVTNKEEAQEIVEDRLTAPLAPVVYNEGEEPFDYDVEETIEIDEDAILEEE